MPIYKIRNGLIKNPHRNDLPELSKDLFYNAPGMWSLFKYIENETNFHYREIVIPLYINHSNFTGEDLKIPKMEDIYKDLTTECDIIKLYERDLNSTWRIK